LAPRPSAHLLPAATTRQRPQPRHTIHSPTHRPQPPLSAPTTSVRGARLAISRSQGSDVAALGWSPCVRGYSWVHVDDPSCASWPLAAPRDVTASRGSQVRAAAEASSGTSEGCNDTCVLHHHPSPPHRLPPSARRSPANPGTPSQGDLKLTPYGAVFSCPAPSPPPYPPLVTQEQCPRDRNVPYVPCLRY